MVSPPSQPPSCAIHLLISGTVQGVAYRYHTRQQAQALGVTGWVRNLPDRRVEAWIEGEKTPVEALVQWCHQGPPAAIVSHVEVKTQTPQGFSDFRIRHGDLP